MWIVQFHNIPQWNGISDKIWGMYFYPGQPHVTPISLVPICNEIKICYSRIQSNLALHLFRTTSIDKKNPDGITILEIHLEQMNFLEFQIDMHYREKGRWGKNENFIDVDTFIDMDIWLERWKDGWMKKKKKRNPFPIEFLLSNGMKWHSYG